MKVLAWLNNYEKKRLFFPFILKYIRSLKLGSGVAGLEAANQKYSCKKVL